MPSSCRHTVLSGEVSETTWTIDPGVVLEFDPLTSTTLHLTGNLVVEGTLRMRPASPDVVHRIVFEDVDEAAFVGGGMEVLDTDVGLWVIGHGRLDAQGHERLAWNRTGDDPSWLPTDELVTAPYAPGDFTTFAPFTKGAPVPGNTAPDGTFVPTEVLNLTRNVWIEGTPTGRAHVMFLHGHDAPQTIRHIGIRYMGPRRNTGDTYRSGGIRHPVTAGVLGRYGLHFHHAGDGSRGTLIEGVLIRDAGNNAFVPHLSHGITMRHCVVFNGFDAGFWWDPGDETVDITYDRCAVMLIRTSPDFRGYGTVGYRLGEGLNMAALHCVAVGVRSGGVNGGGFAWPASANHANNVWRFEDCVAHNNRDIALAIWQNDKNPHVIDRPVVYRNGVGINHGAYANTYTYSGGLAFANGVELDQHAVGRITFDHLRLLGQVKVSPHALPSQTPVRYIDCTFGGLIVVDEAGKDAGVIRFESSAPEFDLTPDRFQVISVLSTITVHNSDGTSFTVSSR